MFPHCARIGIHSGTFVSSGGDVSRTRLRRSSSALCLRDIVTAGRRLSTASTSSVISIPRITSRRSSKVTSPTGSPCDPVTSAMPHTGDSANIPRHATAQPATPVGRIDLSMASCIRARTLPRGNPLSRTVAQRRNSSRAAIQIYKSRKTNSDRPFRRIISLSFLPTASFCVVRNLVPLGPEHEGKQMLAFVCRRKVPLEKHDEASVRAPTISAWHPMFRSCSARHDLLAGELRSMPLFAPVTTATSYLQVYP
jgi:hypothetical protein